MTNRNAVLLFLHKTVSVLFPSNKYQIKVSFPFFRLFQNGFHWFSSVQEFLLCCLEFHSESGGWGTAAGRRPGPPPWAMQALLLPSASDSLWAPLPDPIPLLLGEMSYTTGIKTITSIQQRTEKGWR